MIGIEFFRFLLMLMLGNVVLRIALAQLVRLMPSSPLPNALAFAIV